MFPASFWIPKYIPYPTMPSANLQKTQNKKCVCWMNTFLYAGYMPEQIKLTNVKIKFNKWSYENKMFLLHLNLLKAWKFSNYIHRNGSSTHQMTMSTNVVFAVFFDRKRWKKVYFSLVFSVAHSSSCKMFSALDRLCLLHFAIELMISAACFALSWAIYHRKLSGIMLEL